MIIHGYLQDTSHRARDQREGPPILTNKAQSQSLGDQMEIPVSGTINGVGFEGLFISMVMDLSIRIRTEKR